MANKAVYGLKVQLAPHRQFPKLHMSQQSSPNILTVSVDNGITVFLCYSYIHLATYFNSNVQLLCLLVRKDIKIWRGLLVESAWYWFENSSQLKRNINSENIHTNIFSTYLIYLYYIHFCKVIRGDRLLYFYLTFYSIISSLICSISINMVNG